MKIQEIHFWKTLYRFANTENTDVFFVSVSLFSIDFIHFPCGQILFKLPSAHLVQHHSPIVLDFAQIFIETIEKYIVHWLLFDVNIYRFSRAVECRKPIEFLQFGLQQILEITSIKHVLDWLLHLFTEMNYFFSVWITY